jgi:molybdate/tungstate transport system substrate-binding protein
MKHRPLPWRHLLRRAATPLAFLACFAVLFSACGSPTSSTTSPVTPTTKPSGQVQVMYAASLESIMEKQIAPAFDQSTGYTFEGEAKGSLALANEIKGHLHRPDIFISASPSVNKQLMGAANGNYVSWYVNFARSEMVIGYNPQSRFAADFQAAAKGSKPWYQVLEEPGLRLGRTDPILDPKGQATIYLMELAESYYHQPGLTQKVLGADENASQIFPEEELVARLGAGQLDAGFFYINEAKAAHFPFITLPDQVNLGNPSLASTYASVAWTNPQTKAVSKGGPIVFTLTIPSTSQNQAGAQAFANFLLSSQGQNILQGSGLLSTPFTASGNTSAVPQSLRKYIAS